MDKGRCACSACWPDYPFFRVCATCGNKRCPHATDHRLTCTNSNEPGQPGSSYGLPMPTEPSPASFKPGDRVRVTYTFERMHFAGRSANVYDASGEHYLLDAGLLEPFPAAAGETDMRETIARAVEGLHGWAGPYEVADAILPLFASLQAAKGVGSNDPLVIELKRAADIETGSSGVLRSLCKQAADYIASLQDRASRAERERDRSDTLLAIMHAERDMAIERADAAEARTRDLEQQIHDLCMGGSDAQAEVRQAWWNREHRKRKAAEASAAMLNQVIVETAAELGCEADNEAILIAIHDLKDRIRDAYEALEPFAAAFKARPPIIDTHADYDEENIDGDPPAELIRYGDLRRAQSIRSRFQSNTTQEGEVQNADAR